MAALAKTINRRRNLRMRELLIAGAIVAAISSIVSGVSIASPIDAPDGMIALHDEVDGIYVRNGMLLDYH